MSAIILKVIVHGIQNSVLTTILTHGQSWKKRAILHIRPVLKKLKVVYTLFFRRLYEIHTTLPYWRSRIVKKNA
jgi:hypothetical protein